MQQFNNSATAPLLPPAMYGIMGVCEFTPVLGKVRGGGGGGRIWFGGGAWWCVVRVNDDVYDAVGDMPVVQSGVLRCSVCEGEFRQ